jgi:hypothetical protein
MFSAASGTRLNVSITVGQVTGPHPGDLLRFVASPSMLVDQPGGLVDAAIADQGTAVSLDQPPHLISRRRAEQALQVGIGQRRHRKVGAQIGHPPQTSGFEAAVEAFAAAAAVGISGRGGGRPGSGSSTGSRAVAAGPGCPARPAAG